MQITRDQYYLFTMPDDRMCPVWVEVFLTDGTHHVAPSPFLVMDSAVTYLQESHRGAIVDEIDLDGELAEVREWARTMPLEQLPAVTV